LQKKQFYGSPKASEDKLLSKIQFSAMTANKNKQKNPFLESIQGKNYYKDIFCGFVANKIQT
jgi:hypothetical protein